VPSASGRNLVFYTCFLGHLEKEQVRQFGDVLMIGHSVIFEDVAKVPEPGNDVGGDSAHRWLMFSLMTRYRRVLAAVGALETMEPGAPRSPHRPFLAKPPRRWLRSHVYDEHGTSEFNKVVRHKGYSNVGHMLCHKRFECHIGDVPRRDQKELIGHSLYGEGITKSASFVTTIARSRTDRSPSSGSGVLLPLGKSSVCTASCPKARS